MCWWCVHDVFVMCWWCVGDALVMVWWCVGDVLNMFWWCVGDALVMLWWYFCYVFTKRMTEQNEGWMYQWFLIKCKSFTNNGNGWDLLSHFTERLVWIFPKKLELSGAIWRSLERNLSSLALPWAILSYPELPGAIWSYLELSAGIWRYLEASRAIWSYLELSEALTITQKHTARKQTTWAHVIEVCVSESLPFLSFYKHFPLVFGYIFPLNTFGSAGGAEPFN